MGVKFLYSNDFDSGTVTASSEAAGYPVSNIQHHWHTRHWRSTGLAAEWVKVDLGETKPIKALVIKYHNFQLGATVRIQAHADDTHWDDPDLNELLTITADQINKLWTVAKSYRWWRLLITDAGNPDGYVRIGREFLGGYSTITRPISYGFIQELIDPSNVLHSTGGQISANILTQYKELTYVFRALVAADIVTLKSIFASVGQRVPYFFCEIADGSVTYYVRNTAPWIITNMMGELYELEISLEEMR